MSKDQNTMAKRLPDNEEKGKAEKKRESKRRKSTSTANSLAAASERIPDEHHLSKSELRVLETFRRYLMSPGQMLCFNGQDIESMRDGLEKLIDSGMLIAEGSRGAYSLTRQGFDAMKMIGDSGVLMADQ